MLDAWDACFAAFEGTLGTIPRAPPAPDWVTGGMRNCGLRLVQVQTKPAVEPPGGPELINDALVGAGGGAAVVAVSLASPSRRPSRAPLFQPA